MKRTGPTAKTVMQVVMRDHGLCAVCGKGCHGERGRDWSVQHRLRRGSGGTVREFVNLPANLIVLHGSGTTGCHGRVENERAWAAEFGYRVTDGVLLPAEVAVLHAGHGGWTMLCDDGSVEVFPRCPECRCDPMTCELDPIGAHCEDQSCPTCLHGCPLDDCSVCADSLPERAP